MVKVVVKANSYSVVITEPHSQYYEGFDEKCCDNEK